MTVALPTAEEVLVLVRPTTLSEEEVDVIIGDAALMVEHCVAKLSDERQAAIVKYVAAHIIATTGRGGGRGLMMSKKLGDASETYARGTFGGGLSSSVFGKQALALDPSGCLLNLGSETLFMFKVL